MESWLLITIPPAMGTTCSLPGVPTANLGTTCGRLHPDTHSTRRPSIPGAGDSGPSVTTLPSFITFPALHPAFPRAGVTTSSHVVRASHQDVSKEAMVVTLSAHAVPQEVQVAPVSRDDATSAAEKGSGGAHLVTPDAGMVTGGADVVPFPAEVGTV